MTVKKIIGQVHRWLGFTSGLLVFIIAVTGCLYAFQAEIQDLVQPFRFVRRQPAEMLPPSRLKAVAEAALPGKKIHAVLYSGPDRSAQVIFYNFDPDYYFIVFVDPYTARVLEVKNMDEDFFRIVLEGHFYLWLPPQLGQPVVAIATLIFVIMLITGLILWWPRQWKDARQRFTIKWKARWRRVNYDLHNVLGFYVLFIACILALTGLVWGFQWFAQGVYAAAGGGKSLAYTDPVSDTTRLPESPVPAVDRIFDRMQQEYPSAESIEVHIPVSKADAISANANPDLGTYWKTDYRYYDQNTLEELPVDHIYGRFPEADAADKVILMNYDIHTGAILGLPGKILAFFASLVCASLPVTGVYIWWGRRNKIIKMKPAGSLLQSGINAAGSQTKQT